MRPIRTISVFPDAADAGEPDLRVLRHRGGGADREADAAGRRCRHLGRDQRDAERVLDFRGDDFDGLDGYVARLARTSSDFGAQLDSLSDVVSSAWRRGSCW